MLSFAALTARRRRPTVSIASDVLAAVAVAETTLEQAHATWRGPDAESAAPPEPKPAPHPQGPILSWSSGSGPTPARHSGLGRITMWPSQPRAMPSWYVAAATQPVASLDLDTKVGAGFEGKGVDVLNAAAQDETSTALTPRTQRSAVRRSPVRRALSAAATVMSLGLLAFWLVALRPLSLGGPANYTVIHGNSMWPLYHDGDLIITHKQASYSVGDVVAYNVPKGEIGAGHLVIHRIIGGSTSTGLILQGDNNPHPDPWHPTFGDVAGSTWVQIGRAGRVMALLHQPLAMAGIATLLVLPMLLRRKRHDDDAGNDADSCNSAPTSSQQPGEMFRPVDERTPQRLPRWAPTGCVPRMPGEVTWVTQIGTYW